MSDLADYFSDKARIKELEIELELMTIKYKNQMSYKSKYKLKFEELVGHKEKTRGEKAALLVKELKGTDKPIKLMRAIAEICFLSYSQVRKIWYVNT